jgi:acyl carrier protein
LSDEARPHLSEWIGRPRIDECPAAGARLTEGAKEMEEVLAKVQRVFSAIFDIDPQSVSMETTPDDVVGWDSVGHLELATNLESVFEVSFDVDELMEMENVREIVRVIQPKLSRP